MSPVQSFVTRRPDTAREALLLAAGLPNPDGAGLRPDRELARGDVDARKSHSRAVDFHASAVVLGDDPRDLNPGLGRRVVDRRRLDLRGRPLAALAATPEADGLIKGSITALIVVNFFAPLT